MTYYQTYCTTYLLNPELIRDLGSVKHVTEPPKTVRGTVEQWS